MCLFTYLYLFNKSSAVLFCYWCIGFLNSNPIPEKQSKNTKKSTESSITQRLCTNLVRPIEAQGGRSNDIRSLETTPKSHLRSRRTLLKPIYNKAGHEYLNSSQNKRSIRDKQKRIEKNCIRLTSLKVHLCKTIYDWLRIVPYRAIYSCIFQQTRSNNSNVVQFCKQYLDHPYACLDAIKVLFYKIGPRNRHWSAFAERCIHNARCGTIRRGRCQSFIV